MPHSWKYSNFKNLLEIMLKFDLNLWFLLIVRLGIDVKFILK